MWNSALNRSRAGVGRAHGVTARYCIACCRYCCWYCWRWSEEPKHHHHRETTGWAGHSVAFASLMKVKRKKARRERRTRRWQIRGMNISCRCPWEQPMPTRWVNRRYQRYAKVRMIMSSQDRFLFFFYSNLNQRKTIVILCPDTQGYGRGTGQQGELRYSTERGGMERIAVL